MPRVEIPFAGSSKQHRSSIISNQVCRNWFIEINKDDNGKEQFRSLIGTPGKTLLANVSGQSCRALYMGPAKYPKYWAVYGKTLYEFSANNTFIAIGDLQTSQNPVYIADNGTHILIVDGSTKGYVYDMSAGGPAGFSTIADVNFIGGDHVAFMHGYFFVIQPGSTVLQSCTAPYGTAPITWNALDVTSVALQDAGPVIALGVANDVLWAIGDYSTSVYQDTANSIGFPFSLVTGTNLNFGTSSRAAVKELNGSLIFPYKSKKGEGSIIRTSGISYSRISDHPLEYNIGRYGNIANSYADTYTEEGHSFYQVTFPTGNQTWVWDQTTGEWHERSSYGLGRDRAFGHIYFNGIHIVGDYTTGLLYQQSLDIFSENGQPLIATRRCQHLVQARNPLEIPALIIDCETGVGLGGDVQGSDPQMSLRYSRDTGKTWSDEQYSSMGRIGDFSALVRFPRLGQSEDWVFEISVSDPVKRTIRAAYVET